MKEIYNTRVGQYVTFGLIYMIIWKLGGFEFAVVIALGTILGELNFKNTKN